MWFLNLRIFWQDTLASIAIHKPKYLLLTVIIIGFILRVNNLTIGFPQLFVSNDEAIYHQSALNMLAKKTPFTLGNYGPLGSYIQIPFILLAFMSLFLTGKINSVSDLEFLLVTQEGYLLFIPRVISAMFGTLTILAIYFLARELFKKPQIALWASFFSAVSFNLVHISHLARAWSPAIFFSMLSILFAVKSVIIPKNELRNTILAFLAAAVSFGFHQLSGISILLVILIRVLGGTRTFSWKSIKITFLGFFVWFVSVFLLNYLSLGVNFLTTISPNNPQVGLILLPQNINSLTSLLHYFLIERSPIRVLYDLLLTDGIIVILAILFIVDIKHRFFKIYLTFFIFIMINLLLVMVFFPPFLRYFLISIAIFPVFAGYIINKFLTLKKRAFLIAAAVVTIASFNSIYWNALILRKPAFDLMRQWVDANIRVETPIAATQMRNVGYVPNSLASAPIRKIRPGYYQRTAKLVGEGYPKNVRNIIYVDQFKNDDKLSNLKEAMILYPVIYVIDPYQRSEDRLINHRNEFNLELVAHFSPTGDKIYKDYIPEALFDAPTNFPLFRLKRPGPYFDILKSSNICI